MTMEDPDKVDNSTKSPIKDLEQSLETPGEKKKRIISVFVCHMSMFLSGFGNSLIYIGMYPYIKSVSFCQNIYLET